MAEGATWGISIIVRWILIFAVIFLLLWALYNLFLKPLSEIFGKDTFVPAISFLLTTKGFKSGNN